ncbi:unnamed protein product [Notodromas monacha]|uniref:FAM91 N-terminal domain-containing protein n=1 Tax=Notodromas monacha TaxID=399045 RepID=A0A7R9C2C1_9CRUS|nr:unnamed protein product [Notodromas monacha]CAG0925644.1 unnamed protein product [Notodromas monacha]
MKTSVRGHLPSKPVDVPIEPWWHPQIGCITDDDMKSVTTAERDLIDKLIDSSGADSAGAFDYHCIHSLYRKGLIYLDVPIEKTDCVSVPPLEGFVMNRLMGDYLETLLYKVFVSLDDTTSVQELATLLQIDIEMAQRAVSMFCRLGFAHRKALDYDKLLQHPSWREFYQVPMKRC